MSPKTHPKLTLTEEEMVERIREAKQEDANGQLVHCTSEAEVREYFAATAFDNQ